MILAFIITVLLLIIDLYTDLRAKKVNHFRGGLLRAPVFVADYFLADGSFTFVLAAAYWLFFDMSFAISRRKHPLWLGTTGLLDRLQAPLPYWARGVLKGGLLIFSIYIYTK